ncbi:MAG: DinB family protein [Vicinamibacterales bacterium]
MSIRVVDLLRAVDTARGRTSRLAARIPENALEWAPTPQAFTSADLVRHLAAAERYLFVEIALGRPSRYPGHDRSLAYGKEGVLAYLELMHEQSMTLLQGLDDEALERRVTAPTGAALPTWRWLQLLVEHEAHHRGQLALMLRQLGVESPPLFGLAEAEVAGPSQPDGSSTGR